MCGSATQAKPPRPRPVSRRGDALFEETLFQDELHPVCSPALLAERGRPSGPAELRDWPLLYDLGWISDWAYWFETQDVSAPDLSQSSGFRQYRMVIDAAVSGLGAAIGRSELIKHELADAKLIPHYAPSGCRP